MRELIFHLKERGSPETFKTGLAHGGDIKDMIGT